MDSIPLIPGRAPGHHVTWWIVISFWGRQILTLFVSQIVRNPFTHPNMTRQEKGLIAFQIPGENTGSFHRTLWKLSVFLKVSSRSTLCLNLELPCLRFLHEPQCTHFRFAFNKKVPKHQLHPVGSFNYLYSFLCFYIISTTLRTAILKKSS